MIIGAQRGPPSRLHHTFRLPYLTVLTTSLGDQSAPPLQRSDYVTATEALALSGLFLH